MLCWVMPGASAAARRTRLLELATAIMQEYGYPKVPTEADYVGPGPHAPLILGTTLRHVQPVRLTDGRIVLPYDAGLAAFFTRAGYTVPAPVEIDGSLFLTATNEADPVP